VSTRWIIAAALFVATLVSGCSVALKITYNQGPTLLYWWLDGYVDFNDDQTPRVRQLIEQWFAWNRRERLPEYARLLARFDTEVQQPVLAPQAMCSAATDVKREVQLAYEHAVPSFAEVALSITPEQVRNIEKRFAKNNAKFRDEYLSGDVEDRLKAQAKKAMERFEMVYGSLDNAQRERIRQALAASPYDPEAWLAERKLLQQEIVQGLRQLQAARAASADPQQLMAQAQAALRAVGQHANESPRPAYRVQQQKVWDYNCGFVAQIHNTMSPAQRQHAVRKFRRWEEDVRALYANR
jgi:hypothetical protein